MMNDNSRAAYYESLFDLQTEVTQRYTAEIVPLLRKRQSELETQVSVLQVANTELARQKEELQALAERRNQRLCEVLEELAELKGRLQGLEK